MVIAFIHDDFLNANGWYLRRLYADIIQRNELDEDFKFNLYMQTDSYKFIDFGDMQPDRRKKLMRMLKELAIEIIGDTDNIHQEDINSEKYQIYKEALKELLSRIEKYENVEWPNDKKD